MGGSPITDARGTPSSVEVDPLGQPLRASIGHTCQAIHGLSVSKDLLFRKCRATYELLYDVRPDRATLKRAFDLGADLFSFIRREYVETVSAPLPYPRLMDNVALLRVSTYDTWWTKQITKKTRNMVRKAERAGIKVNISGSGDDIEGLAKGIWRIYNESPVRQGRYFPHYGAALETVRDGLKCRIREGGTGMGPSSEVFSAYLDGEMIGFSEVLYGDGTAQISQILSLLSQFNNSPNNALLSAIVRRCADQGYPSIIYGRMGLSHPSLTRFKESNGFRQFNLNRYFIPLTYRGAVAISLGLHRQLKDVMPEKLRYSLLPLYSFTSRKLKVEL